MSTTTPTSELQDRFGEIGQAHVTFDTNGGYPRLSTTKPVADNINIEQGDRARFFKADDDTLIIRFE